jgi:hypothetical protein
LSGFSLFLWEVSMKRALFAAVAAASLLLVKVVPGAVAQTAIDPDGHELVAATLFEEDPNDRFGAPIAGGARWRLQRGTSGSASETQVSAEAAIPGRRLFVSLAMRANPDRAGSASHFIDIKFTLPRDFQLGGISDVRGITMKQSEEVRGRPLHPQGPPQCLYFWTLTD